MKKVILYVVMLCTVLSLGICVFASDVHENATEEAYAPTFVKVKAPLGEMDSWLALARYKDTKEVIPLSMPCGGYIHATVPYQHKDREIEAFIPEPIAFNDIDDYNPDFHDMKMLSYSGVMRGDENGNANIYQHVTRAEAVAMVMRLIGLENAEMEYKKLRFDDVREEDWFYSVVMNAFNCGIVQGDSERTFSPNREVTREEITVMVARAIKYAGVRCGTPQAENNADKDQISDWAKDAYAYIGHYYVSDADNTDPENPVRLLKPQQAATRADIAYMLNNIQAHSQMYATDVAEYYGFDKQMPVIDGSTSTYPFTTAVYGAMFYGYHAHPQYPQSHSKSHASYERLINGEVDMLFASVYPASDILEMAEEKGVELELIPIAYDAMIFFTNKDNPATGLTTEQISNIYVNDAYDNWSEVGGSDALMYPYCRNNDSGSHAQMEKHFLNGNEIHPEVQKETSYTMSNVLTDVMAAKTDDPIGYGLGYSIYYYYHNMFLFYPVEEELKLLAIDGVMPTDETIANGTYPLSNNTYVVLRKDTPEDAPARKMAEFMLTEAGQQCVENAGYGKLKQTVEFSDDLLFADKLNVQMPTDKNYMFSPVSIKMALALAANGASGETQTEILNALGLSSLDEFNSVSKDLISRYSQTDILSLNIANSIWINKDQTTQDFSEDFKAIATEYYNADVKTINNSNAVKEINSWVSDKTNGKIPTIIQSANDFWTMLVNAIYFKGTWQDEFSVNATKPDQFNNADGTKITIDFMNKTKWFPYTKTNSVQIIELPYQNRLEKFSDDGEYLDTEVYKDLDVSMYLIMPEGDINVEQELSAAINDESFESTYIKMSMPKFRIEYETSLNQIFKNMGITTAFDHRVANFEKMFDKGNMWFTKTIHKTFINVDEKRTEAAAVTAIVMPGSGLPPEPIELKFNKPFYFAIRDNTDGEILFLGRFAYAE